MPPSLRPFASVWPGALRREAPALLVLLAIALTFEPLLSGREVLWGDFITWYVPSHNLAAERLWQGQLPLWNPYSDSGMPFLGEADHATFYPPSLVLHLVGRDPVVLFDALQAFTLAHLAWAGLGLYVLARSLGCSPWAASFGAIAFSLSGALVARAAHVSLVCALSWLPLALGGLQRSIERRGLGSALGAAVAFGMIALSGSPSSLVVATVGAALLTVATAWAQPGDSRLQTLARGLGLLAGTAGVGVALGAVQLLPMRELVQHSERSSYTYADVAAFALDPGSLILLLVPRYFGWLRYDAVTYWGPQNFSEISAYGGLLTLPLAWLAWSAPSARLARPWALMGLGGLWLALGASGGLHGLFYLVPVVGQSRAPGRFLALWACGVAVLAAFGLDRALARARSLPVARWRSRTLVGLGLLGAWIWHTRGGAAAGLLAWQLDICRPILAATFLAGLASGGLLLAWRWRPTSRFAGVAACLVLVVDLAAQWRGAGLYPRAALQRVLDRGTDRYDVAIARLQPPLRTRSRYENPGRLLLTRARSDAGPGRHLLVYQRFQDAIVSIDSPLLDVLGIGYLAEVTSREIVALGPNLVASSGLYLTDGAALDLALDPGVHADGVELVLTVNPLDQPSGTTFGHVALRGPEGERSHPLRLAIETGNLSGGHLPSAASLLDVRHFVHVRDPGAIQREYYRVVLRGAPISTSSVRLSHVGGPTALLVKEVRLLRTAGPADRWQPWRTEEANGPFPRRVFANSRVRPRAWLARRVRFVGSPQQAIDRLNDSDLDPRLDATIEAPIGPARVAESSPFADVPGQARLVRDEPERIVVEAHAKRPAWLILGEVDYPGWTATVDGRAAPIARSHGLLRAVHLAPGSHRVEFAYGPPSFAVGAAISLGAALALAWGAGLVRRRLG